MLTIKDTTGTPTHDDSGIVPIICLALNGAGEKTAHVPRRHFPESFRARGVWYHYRGENKLHEYDVYVAE